MKFINSNIKILLVYISLVLLIIHTNSVTLYKKSNLQNENENINNLNQDGNKNGLFSNWAGRDKQDAVAGQIEKKAGQGKETVSAGGGSDLTKGNNNKKPSGNNSKGTTDSKKLDQLNKKMNGGNTSEQNNNNGSKGTSGGNGGGKTDWNGKNPGAMKDPNSIQNKAIRKAMINKSGNNESQKKSDKLYNKLTANPKEAESKKAKAQETVTGQKPKNEKKEKELRDGKQKKKDQQEKNGTNDKNADPTKSEDPRKSNQSENPENNSNPNGNGSGNGNGNGSGNGNGNGNGNGSGNGNGNGSGGNGNGNGNGGGNGTGGGNQDGKGNQGGNGNGNGNKQPMSSADKAMKDLGSAQSDNEECSKGSAQSPISLSAAKPKEVKVNPITIKYNKPVSGRLWSVNNVYTMAVEPKDRENYTVTYTDPIKNDGNTRTFTLEKVVIITRALHTGNFSSNLEIIFIHKSADQKRNLFLSAPVTGTNPGEDTRNNPKISKHKDALNLDSMENSTINTMGEYFNKEADLYVYEGSTIFSSCVENVTWVVSGLPLQLSKANISSLVSSFQNGRDKELAKNTESPDRLRSNLEAKPIASRKIMHYAPLKAK